MSGKRILALEADPIYANMLTDELGARGYEVEVLSDGVEGLDKATATPPDLIYLCVELPRVSGFSICNKLRKSPETKDIPLVITSHEATEETFEKHKKLKVRADEYMHKPFTGKQLLKVVGGLLGGGEDIELDADDATGGATGDILFEDGEGDLELGDVEEIPVEEEGDLELEEIADLEDAEEAPAAAPNVDDEMGAFADEAFAALEIAKEQAPAKAAPAKAIAKERAAAAPAAAAGPSARETELAADLTRMKTLNEDLSSKLAKLERELATAKTSKGGGVSSREFLDLRELLNKKDRELLDLKDSVNNKEKQLLDLRERATELERDKADLEDKNIAFAKQVNELEESVTALNADKDLLHKKGRDLEGRIAQLEQKAAGVQGELSEERDARRADVERLEGEKAELKTRMEGALEDQKIEAEARLQASLKEQKAELAREQAAALAEQKAKLESEAAERRERDLAEQRLRHEDDVEGLRAELVADKEQALKEQESSFAVKLGEVEEGHGRAIEELASQLAEAEARSAELADQKAELEATLATAREELSASEKQIAELTESVRGLKDDVAKKDSRVGAMAKDLDETKAHLSGQLARARELEGDVHERDRRIASLETEVEEMSEILGRNDELVEKTRQALAIAANLLDQIETDGEEGEEK